MKLFRFSVILLFLSFLPVQIIAQEEYDVKEHYYKTEVDIPMRDGTKLHTTIYSPKDTSKEYPILFLKSEARVPPNNLSPIFRKIIFHNLGVCRTRGAPGMQFMWRSTKAALVLVSMQECRRRLPGNRKRVGSADGDFATRSCWVSRGTPA